ncbi:MAG: hypothetical protein M3345_04885 [Actinomycetota bacterium]|nr:hypothetical protein [Actinomycetota bacterium]
MNEMFCPQCRLEQPVDHRYCARCGASLPSHLVKPAAKSARFFAGVKVADGDPEQGFLKVSCYLREQHLYQGDRQITIPGHHVRFSMWVEDRARCVISIPISQARELTDYLHAELGGIDNEMVAEVH